VREDATAEGDEETGVGGATWFSSGTAKPVCEELDAAFEDVAVVTREVAGRADDFFLDAFDFPLSVEW
jgi:hypothetical protein